MGIAKEKVFKNHPNSFIPEEIQVFSYHVVVKNFLVVNDKLKSVDKLIVVSDHWPIRSSGR